MNPQKTIRALLLCIVTSVAIPVQLQANPPDTTNQTQPTIDLLKGYTGTIQALIANPQKAVLLFALTGATYYLSGFADPIIKTGVKHSQSVYATLSDAVVNSYTLEKAERELLTIEAAKINDDTESLNTAAADHFIKILYSMYGRHRLFAGNPEIEKHVQKIQPHMPEYARFLLCLHRHNNYKHLKSIVNDDVAKTDSEYGECEPPYSIKAYLENHPDRETIKEIVKNITQPAQA